MALAWPTCWGPCSTPTPPQAPSRAQVGAGRFGVGWGGVHVGCLTQMHHRQAPSRAQVGWDCAASWIRAGQGLDGMYVMMGCQVDGLGFRRAWQLAGDGWVSGDAWVVCCSAQPLDWVLLASHCASSPAIPPPPAPQPSTTRWAPRRCHHSSVFIKLPPPFPAVFLQPSTTRWAPRRCCPPSSPACCSC